VVEMDRATAHETFNSYDPETGRVLITPRGPDPVLFGVRGESPEAVHQAMEMLRVEEPIERWVIFRTNQGTDAHLGEPTKLSRMMPHLPIVAFVEVVSKPKTIPGGHVILHVRDETGEADAAAYEPTGGFREIVKRLIPGDIIRVYGGVRLMGGGVMTINLEKLEILELARDVRLINPTCPLCGSRMKSMGRGKGYRCRRCRHRDEDLRKVEVEAKRTLRPGLYLPPPRAQRHLTKPLRRYGKEKRGCLIGPLFQPWHWP
jgi:tRNA(Ile2)-agmatinylcytidine synthase